MMKWAAKNQTAFFKDVAGKYLNKEASEEEDKRVKRDLVKADKVLDVLAQYRRVTQQRLEEELRDSVSLAVWGEVQDHLAYWERDSGVELSPEARASLQTCVTDLCHRIRIASDATAARQTA